MTSSPSPNFQIFKEVFYENYPIFDTCKYEYFEHINIVNVPSNAYFKLNY